jgi:hypothetical protein
MTKSTTPPNARQQQPVSRLRRVRKQPVAAFCPWDFSREEGDRVYRRIGDSDEAEMIDLYESHGRDKAAAGELSFRVVKKDGRVRRAVLGDDGVWYWAG